MKLSAILALAFVASCGCQSSPASQGGIPKGFAMAPWQLVSETGESTAIPVREVREVEDGFVEVLFLTANHAVEPDEELHLVFMEWEYDAILVGEHPELDLAVVLGIVDVSPVFPELRLDPVPYGDTLFTQGYPAGEGPYADSGIAGMPGTTSSMVLPGMSGGPVLDQQGHLVGVIMSVMVWGPHHTPLPTAAQYTPLFLARDWLVEMGVL